MDPEYVSAFEVKVECAYSCITDRSPDNVSARAHEAALSYGHSRYSP